MHGKNLTRLTPETNHQQLTRLSKILDAAVSIPGTNFKIGLDSLIGLVPGIGDTLSTFVSGYIVYQAAKLGAPRHAVMRMIFNVALDGLLGSIPILGDIFDFAWKANLRNMDILETYIHHAPAPARSNDEVLRFIRISIILIIVAAIILSGLLLSLLWSLIA